MKRIAHILVILLLLLVPLAGGSASALDSFDADLFALWGLNVVTNPHLPFTIHHDEETIISYVLVRESGEFNLVSTTFDAVPLTMILSDASDEEADIFWNLSEEFELLDSVSITVKKDTPYLFVTTIINEEHLGKMLHFALRPAETVRPAERKDPALTLAPAVSPLPIARTLAAGKQTSFFIDERGSLWAAGANTGGAIGQGLIEYLKGFTSIMVYNKAVSAGGSHTLILGEDGRLWATGTNEQGQLGDGTTITAKWPKVITRRVIAIAAGAEHSLYVDSNKTLWATGSNKRGQLGVSGVSSTANPIAVKEGIVQVWTNGEHTSFALTEDGELYGWGANSGGELGLGHRYQVSSPTRIASDIAAVASGKDFSYLLSAEGRLFSSGKNTHGQLGDGSEEDRSTFALVASGVVAVAAGGYTGFYIDASGQLWAAGANDYGQWGTGSRENRSVEDGFVPVARNVTAVAAAEHHALILRTDGALYSAGGNDSYQLGAQHTESRSTWEVVL